MNCRKCYFLKKTSVFIFKKNIYFMTCDKIDVYKSDTLEAQVNCFQSLPNFTKTHCYHYSNDLGGCNLNKLEIEK